ncbi:uncharacterized protein LOC122257277 [Penaeus japonicus]|uniref:uncharacterized protein LOC122257277 n=1 Tax=Penaeus japonicus TaxID=27405 RepID=UPI001C70E4E3|nr:uncharacterized protein LOC122257277 [Penaeus japonicus]
MAASFGLVVQIGAWIFALAPPCLPYQICTVDSSEVCNRTIYLDNGAKSAVILRLTLKDYYDFAPLFCEVTFNAPRHSWTGLVGVLEEVDLRRYEYNHRAGQSECVDSIKVIYDASPPRDTQCGTWSVSPTERLSHVGYRKALMGYCPHPRVSSTGVSQCVVSELKVQVSVGQKDNAAWRNKTWGPHRGFTFVVTAYKYSFGESECVPGWRSCGRGVSGNQHHCVHESLWCDHHINCGQPENMDEISCSHDEILGGLVTVMVGPGKGTVLLLLLYININSYAESYEVSSTLSSAHHMAIQVRVVCNPGPGSYTQRTSPWAAADLPPSYDSLFPQGPPPPPPKCTSSTSSTASTPLSSLTANTTSTITAGGATLATSLDITAKSLAAPGAGAPAAAACASSPSPYKGVAHAGPSTGAGPSASANGYIANATQTSSYGIDNPVHMLCNGTGAHSAHGPDACFGASTSGTCSPCSTPGHDGRRYPRHHWPHASSSSSSSSRPLPTTLPKSASKSHSSSPSRRASSRCVSPSHYPSPCHYSPSAAAAAAAAAAVPRHQVLSQRVMERLDGQRLPAGLPDLASAPARRREELSSPGECDDTTTLLRDRSPSTDEEVLAHPARPPSPESPPPPAPTSPSARSPTPTADEDAPGQTTPTASGVSSAGPPAAGAAEDDGHPSTSSVAPPTVAISPSAAPSTASLADKPMVVRASTMDSETADTLTSTTSWGTLSTDITEVSFADDLSQNTL